LSKPLALSKPSANKHPTAQDAARFHAELAALQNAYCDIFKLWLFCRIKHCRRQRACRGDRNACLKRGTKDIPRAAQFQARKRIMAAAPKNAGSALGVIPHCRA
jgi:hypothetical protein